MSVARFLARRKSFLHMALGSGIASFNAYAVLNFFPSYLERSHGMDLQVIGIALGLIIGISTGTGFVGGGVVADRVGAKNKRYSLWVVAAAMLLGWMFVFPLYLSSNAWFVLALFFVPSVLNNAYVAVIFAQNQGLIRPRMRSVASSLLLFIINVVGIGLGPQFAGLLSDWLAASYGEESLRYSLLIIGAICGPWTAWHFFVAGRHIEKDLARVGED